MNTLIDKIQDALLSDDDDREEQSEYLTEAYKAASQESKEAIDKCFIALCGWSLKSLIEQ